MTVEPGDLWSFQCDSKYLILSSEKYYHKELGKDVWKCFAFALESQEVYCVYISTNPSWEKIST